MKQQNKFKVFPSLLTFSLFAMTTQALASGLATRDIVRQITFSVNSNGYASREKLKATTKTQGDFNLSNRFAVEVDQKPVDGILSIEGVDLEHDVLEYKDGEDGVSHTRPGNHKPGLLRVTRPNSKSFDWGNPLDTKVPRRSISVIFHNDAGEEAGRLNMYQCVPRKISVIQKSKLQVIDLECDRMEQLIPALDKK